MPTTTNGLTYPSSTSHTRLWEHFQTLAEDVDEALTRKGYITESQRTTVSGTITTTETVIQSVTFDAVAGQRYRITAEQSVQSTVAGDVAQARLRWANGGSVSTAGTQIMSKQPTCALAGKGNPFAITGYLVASATGQVTVGVTLVRSLGTGNITSSGSSIQVNTIQVEGV